MSAIKNASVGLVIAAVFMLSARSQSFLNLNFESAQNLPANPPIPDGTDVPTTNALPGWAAYDGTLALTEINYVSNDLAGVRTVVGLEGGSAALSGDFSVGLNGISSISQTGLVPADAASLQFEASFAASLYASLGGQNLSFSQLSEGPGYTLYGANIPANLDGQVEALIFGVNGPGGTLLDNIEFSTSSVPEPGEWAFVGLWTAFFAVHRRRGRQR